MSKTIKQAAIEYAKWADSPEGMEMLKRRREEMRKWSREMWKSCEVSDEVMRKRYTPISRY